MKKRDKQGSSDLCGERCAWLKVKVRVPVSVKVKFRVKGQMNAEVVVRLGSVWGQDVHFPRGRANGQAKIYSHQLVLYYKKTIHINYKPLYSNSP